MPMVGMLFEGAACRDKPAHSEGPAGTPAVPEDCPLERQQQGTQSKHEAGEALEFTGYGEVR